MKFLAFLFVTIILFSCQAEKRTSREKKSSCRENSGPVCGRPPMPPCPEGQMCAQVMPKPQMYPNQCELEKAKATPLPRKACREMKTK